MAEVSLTDVAKVYPGEVKAVTDFSLEVPDGEFVVLVGPSGCGKSTTLRMVAGLEEITSGSISIGGRVVNDVPPKDRDIAMVFQNYALYPHMTVYGNMAFGRPTAEGALRRAAPARSGRPRDRAEARSVPLRRAPLEP
jgi:multiple sugar transport system ATP-binding protein